MVRSAPGGAEDVDRADALYVVQHPSHGLCLVVMLLLILADDYVCVFLLQCGRERVHVSDNQIRKSFLSKDLGALLQELGQGPVTAYDEVCGTDDVFRVFRLRKASVAYDDYAFLHDYRPVIDEEVPTLVL